MTPARKYCSTLRWSPPSSRRRRWGRDRREQGRADGRPRQGRGGLHRGRRHRRAAGAPFHEWNAIYGSPLSYKITIGNVDESRLDEHATRELIAQAYRDARWMRCRAVTAMRPAARTKAT